MQSEQISIEKKRDKILRAQRIGTICFAVVMLTAFIFVYVKYGKQLYNVLCDEKNLAAFLKRFGGYDKVMFVAIRAFQTVIKIIPAEPLEIGSGYLYGTWGGLLLCILGTEIGSVVIIVLTKLFGRKMVDLFVPIEKFDNWKIFDDSKRLYFLLFIVYLMPGTPKDVITYAAGMIKKINLPLFFLITGVARLPSIITSTWCGQKLIEKDYTSAIIIFALTAVASVICALIYKALKKKEQAQQSNEQNDTEETD